MKKIIPLIPIIIVILLMASCSQEKKLLRKASVAVDQSDFDKAIAQYDEILAKNDKSFFGNAGKGIVLSEYMSRHEQAIPYLEKALANSPPDKTKPILHGNLGKSYHFIGNYARALTYYGTLDNNPDYSDYDEFLTKRIADCKYAIAHPEVAPPENQSIVNVGNTVNTDKPEYTPVFTNNSLFFTSKRQDDPKEKKNGIDGKFFESVYLSEMKEGTFGPPQKVELGSTEGMRSEKFGEAVASASPDGQKLYIYKGGQLYETGTNDKAHKMTALDKAINFSKLQNHASLSPDGKTMYFTSESDKGRGGSDIYYAQLKDDGTWGEPKAMGNAINTPYDEEAPFVSERGVLFFSSNGHPGYGGFDVYKSEFVNGNWSSPENLGQPINSPGDDVFFMLLKNSSKGYYASARPGGFGDLDIYKVHYVMNTVSPCNPTDNMISINAEPSADNPMAYNVNVTVPEQYKSNIRTYRWEVDGKPIAAAGDKFTHTFSSADKHQLTAKVVAWCDTCPQLIGMCSTKEVEVKNDVLASNTNNTKTGTGKDLAANNKNNKNFGKKGKNSGTNDDASATDSNADSDNKGGVAGAGTKNKNKKNNSDNNSDDDSNDASSNNASNKNAGGSGTSAAAGVMSENDLKALNWNNSAAYFDYNQSELNADAKAILDHNISILNSKEDLKVVINGYADSRGPSDYNKNLSAKRAQAVKDYLISHGVKSSRIKSVKAHGEQNLLNSCTDGVECSDDQHRENRRVKFDVIGKAQSISLN
jgi:outer membrane protein OmpA-like peptidoglycan-associated protein/tetratricopeptide (TPR) repeat protein